jgi:hypothetical protein
METGLHHLMYSGTTSPDELFVFHIRVHKLMQEASRMRDGSEFDPAMDPTSPGSTSIMPKLLYLKSLRSRLIDLVAQSLASGEKTGSHHTSCCSNYEATADFDYLALRSLQSICTLCGVVH